MSAGNHGSRPGARCPDRRVVNKRCQSNGFGNGVDRGECVYGTITDIGSLLSAPSFTVLYINCSANIEYTQYFLCGTPSNF